MTTLSRPGRGLRHRLRPADDTGSLALALLLTLVGVSLSALLVPMVVTQLGATRTSVQRADALNAAQAGTDVTLGRIRAAKDSSAAPNTPNGLINMLPCHVSAPAVGLGNGAAFDVTVIYPVADPRGKPDSWLNDPANQIKCVEGSGTAIAPTYAVLKSTGTTGQTHRLLQSTYQLRVTKQPVRGGQISVNGTNPSLCLDAGTTLPPSSGTQLRVQSCVANSPAQMFAYGTNLNLYLAWTRVPGGDLGWCLDAATPHSVGEPVFFKQCAATTQPSQQWSFNDASNFQATPDGTTLEDYCFAVNMATKLVALQHCASANTFSDEPAVGPGAAGDSSGQLANYSQNGRCLDVPDFDYTEGFLIIWPCKQSPDPTKVSWNQKWTLPAPGSSGPIYTVVPTTGYATPPGRYCLFSNGSTGYHVKLVSCPNLATAQQWTRYGDTGDPATAYHIQDPSGKCLAPSDPTVDYFPKGYQTSKAVVNACDRSTGQRWNSPMDPALEDLSEK